MNSEEIKELLSKNKDYWESRSIASKLLSVENDEDYYTRLDAIYKNGTKQIEEKLSTIYQRYGSNNGLSTEEAKTILPTKIETEYKNDLQDYITKAKSGDPKYYSYLLNQSLMKHHTALNQIQTEFREAVNNLDKNGTMNMYLGKTYQNANYYNSFLTGNEFSKVSQDSIEQLLNENWSGGGNFSQTIWKNKEQLVQSLDDILVIGLANGDSYDKMAKKLSEKMDSSAKAAKRLIMTEAARLQNEGLFNQYKEMEIEQYMIVATLDKKTSEICRAMDGQIFNIEEAEIGWNIPPFHPWCRTTIAPYFKEDEENKDRAWRDKDTGKTIVNSDYTKYEEYLEKHLGEKEQAEALASTKNDLSNLMKTVPYISPITKASTIIGSVLSYAEKRAMVNYVSSDYLSLNYNLREGYELTDLQLDLSTNLSTALQKLEKYDGWVNRVIEVNDLEAFLKDYQIGSINQFNSFTSTSIKDWFSTKANVYYKIYSKNGRILGSHNVTENEVLFDKGSRFQITDIDIDTDKCFITMKEVV